MGPESALGRSDGRAKISGQTAASSRKGGRVNNRKTMMDGTNSQTLRYRRRSDLLDMSLESSDTLETDNSSGECRQWELAVAPLAVHLGHDRIALSGLDGSELEPAQGVRFNANLLTVASARLTSVFLMCSIGSTIES
jgi:hypothetical protein